MKRNGSEAALYVLEIPVLNNSLEYIDIQVTAYTDRSATAPRTLVIGLVVVVLLASLLFGLRGMVMYPAESIPVTHHPPVHGDSSSTHDHQNHCPLCFLLLLLPSPAPEPGVAWFLSFSLQIWYGGGRARDAFLKAIAARGPPVPAALRHQV